jgi:thymidylate synthase ThyX
MVVTFPRYVLAELNTHRMFSRNSASSRAIPTTKQLEMIDNNPFIPFYWGKNQPGMQAHTEVGEFEKREAITAWLHAKDAAVRQARTLLELGVHKQVVNRILEPFMWHTVVITATEWSNFFALRANPDAQPEIRHVAELMLEAYQNSTPVPLEEDEWHLPFIQDGERNGRFEFTEAARKISAARCARVSYLTHEGIRDHDADLRLYDRLVAGGHMSPLEHVATPFTYREILLRDLAVRGLRDAKVLFPGETLTFEQIRAGLEFNGNFRGWTQLRKLREGEEDFSRRGKE